MAGKRKSTSALDKDKRDVADALATRTYGRKNSNLTTFAVVGAILLAATGGGYWYTTTPEGSFYWQEIKNKISALVP